MSNKHAYADPIVFQAEENVFGIGVVVGITTKTDPNGERTTYTIREKGGQMAELPDERLAALYDGTLYNAADKLIYASDAAAWARTESRNLQTAPAAAPAT